MICRSQGYGLGAVAYVRRVVEEKTNELIEVLAQLGASRGLTAEEVEHIRAAQKRKTSYEEKIHIAAEAIPESLKPDGLNPFSTLYQLLSEGVHEKTEDECIQISDDTRDVFEHVFIALRAQIEDVDWFKQKMQKLAEGRRPKSS